MLSKGQCCVNKATAWSSVRQFTVLYTEKWWIFHPPPTTLFFMHWGQIFNQLRSLRPFLAVSRSFHFFQDLFWWSRFAYLALLPIWKSGKKRSCRVISPESLGASTSLSQYLSLLAHMCTKFYARPILIERRGAHPPIPARDDVIFRALFSRSSRSFSAITRSIYYLY